MNNVRPTQTFMPQPGEFYRLVTPDKEFENIDIDDLVYVDGNYTDGLSFNTVGGNTGYYKVDPIKFRECFELIMAPEDYATRRVMGKMQEINNVQPSQVPIPVMGLLPGATEIPVASGETLPTVRQNAKEVKSLVAQARNNLVRFSNEIKKKGDEMEWLIAQQVGILAIKAGIMTKALAKAEEYLWTIHLYLGKDEVLKMLRRGKPAADGTPIHVRQLVLFMDEECMVNVDKGGIDCRNIESFDEWLLADPAHLQQVIPEDRGVVGIRICRLPKYYSDNYWENTKLNEENRRTYFLMRNGENVYRVWADIVVDEYVFPPASEFMKFFEAKEYDSDSHGYKTEKLRPGSKQYVKSMEKADARSRHYMRILMVIQGLLDRTVVFRPMPLEQINLMDADMNNRYLRMIYDGDKSRLLEDGHERFCDWQKRINSTLAIGNRIIGGFGAKGSLSREDNRVTPARAGQPNRHEIYTLDGRKGGGLTFKFNYDHWQGNPAKKRATFLVHPDDCFILNFDEIEVADMEYYITCRLDRHEYLWMIPLLRAAIRLKKEEWALELPFAMMLSGELMKKYHLAREVADEQVPSLVAWWKFKNRTKRAITSDEKSATAMILGEYAKRRAMAAWVVKNHVRIDVATRRLRELRPKAIFIGRSRLGHYVTVTPENDENIFVHLETWGETVVGEPIDRGEGRHWTTVDSNRHSWHVLQKSDAWDSWDFTTNPNSMLTGPELALAIEFARSYKRPTNKWEREEDTGVNLAIIQSYAEGRLKIDLYRVTSRLKLPTERILSQSYKGVKLDARKVVWKKAKGVVTFEMYSTGCYTYSTIQEIVAGKNSHLKAIWLDQQLWDIIQGEDNEYEEFCKERRRLQDIAREVKRMVEQVQRQAIIDREHKAFLDEYKAPDLWDHHRGQLESNHVFTVPCDPRVESACELLLERNIPIEGLTIAQLLNHAAEIRQAIRAGIDRRQAVIDAKRNDGHTGVDIKEEFDVNEYENPEAPEKAEPLPLDMVIKLEPTSEDSEE